VKQKDGIPQSVARGILLEGGRWVEIPRLLVAEEKAESRQRNDCGKTVRHTCLELETRATNLKSGMSKVRIADEVEKRCVIHRHIVAGDVFATL
jgi:hypothetical protein